MKIIIIAFGAAVIVCMLIEFRHKLFGSADRPGEPAPRTGCFLWTVAILIILFIVVPLAVTFFTEEPETGVTGRIPDVPPPSAEMTAPSPRSPEVPGADREKEVPGVVAPPVVAAPVDTSQGTSDKASGIDQPETVSTESDAGTTAIEAAETPVATGNQEQEQETHDVSTPAEKIPEASSSSPPVVKRPELREPDTKPDKTVDSEGTSLADGSGTKASEGTDVPGPEASGKEPAATDSKASQTLTAHPPETPVQSVEKNRESLSDIAVSDEKMDHPVTILIGSYTTREKAFEVASHFSSKGDPAFTSYYTDPYEGSRFQVFMGNYESLEDAGDKARELRERKFRQVDVTSRMFAVQVGECSSYPVSEEIKALLKKNGYIAYGHRCPDVTGHIKIMVGAFLNDQLAIDAAREMIDKGIDLPVTVVLR